MLHKGQYNFVDTVEAGQGLIRSPSHDARTITKAVDIAEDVGYVRRRESEDFYTQLHDAQTDRKDIRLEIVVVRGQRTTYETELHEIADDRAIAHRMRTRVLEARAQIDTVEDTSSSCAALTWWNGYVRTLGHDAAYAMTWGTFKKQLTNKYCPKGEIKKLEIELWNLKIDKYIGGHLDNIHGNVMSTRPKTLDDAIELDNDLMDQKLRTFTERQNDNKRKCVETARGNIRHIKKNYPKLKNHGNGNENGVAQGRAYALGGRDASLDSNIITGTFLLNNRYATILFDTYADRSFVSTTFSSLIDITPTTLENHYDVELANGKIIRVNTIIRGYTLNFMNHHFNIDLMLVSLGSFDVIIGMDWLKKYHIVIICDKKIVRVLFEREMLIFQGDGNNQREESRLNIISCAKTQKYLSKGCDVFLAHITTKEAKDKSEGKRLKDVSIIRDFPKVFPEELPGIPPARQVEFQINLVPGVAPVARAPYRLVPFEMKELVEQLQELFDKGFIRPSSLPGEPQSCL
nr:putative reverse transcriptase domain-containing protein [Tanacetum cinerariifolium]